MTNFLYFPAATEWIKTWKTNGWKTTDGGNVKNQADIENLDNLCRRVDIKWVMRVNGGRWESIA